MLQTAERADEAIEARHWVPALPLAVTLLLVLAFSVRLWSLDRLPMWVDEAESSINALTILEHGLPLGTYLGIPIYENTHIQPWPEHPEYRFKDLSYSDKNVAVYHGWLPLYSIAASLWAAGIRPDDTPSGIVARHDAEARRWRTVAARFPAVLFGLLTLVILYWCGNVLYGQEAGLAALAFGSVSPIHVMVSQQARYYSALVMFSAACGLATWYMVRTRRRRDFLLGGVAFGLLFHTHVLTFATACILLAAAVSASWMQRGHFCWLRLSLFGAVVSILTVPWILATGFLEMANNAPSSRLLLHFRDYMVVFRLMLSEYGAALLIGCISLAWAGARFAGTATQIVIAEIKRKKIDFLFLYVWLVIGYVCFMLLMPAASYHLHRLVILLVAPATLALAMVLAAIARAISARHSAAIATAMALLIGVGSTRFWPAASSREAGIQHADIDAAVSYLSRFAGRHAKVYATPGDHLTLTYYTGTPVQSIAPIRHTYLNTYDGDILFLERADLALLPDDPIDKHHIAQAAARGGVNLSDDEIGAMTHRLATQEKREILARQVASVIPPLSPVPPFLQQEYAESRRRRREEETLLTSAYARHPVFRGFAIRSSFDFWTVFFYRFVDPEKERRNLNYAQRMRNATAEPLKGANWVAYYSPGRGQ